MSFSNSSGSTWKKVHRPDSSMASLGPQLRVDNVQATAHHENPDNLLWMAAHPFANIHPLALFCREHLTDPPARAELCTAAAILETHGLVREEDAYSARRVLVRLHHVDEFFPNITPISLRLGREKEHVVRVEIDDDKVPSETLVRFFSYWHPIRGESLGPLHRSVGGVDSDRRALRVCDFTYQAL